jgi:hypothetical protein
MRRVFERPRGTLGKWFGVKYWKPYFDDLEPFDLLDIHEVLNRQKKTIESFDECKEQQENGHYFLKIDSNQFKHTEVKKLHQKFNHKSVNLNDAGKQIIKFLPNNTYGNIPYRRNYDVHHTIDDRINFQLRDGKVTPGFGTWDWKKYFEAVENKKQSRTKIYLEIPHQVISENLVSLNEKFYREVLPKNGIDIIKKFIKEVETNSGELKKQHAHTWNDTEKVNEIIDKYDELYSDWNFEFPIHAYSSVKRKGLLFPSFAANGGHFIAPQGLHRLIMPAYAQSDVPIILPIPMENNDRYFIFSAHADFKKIDGEYSFLMIDLDRKNKKLFFYLTTTVRYDLKKINRDNFKEWKTEYIGESQYL